MLLGVLFLPVKNMKIRVSNKSECRNARNLTWKSDLDWLSVSFLPLLTFQSSGARRVRGRGSEGLQSSWLVQMASEDRIYQIHFGDGDSRSSVGPKKRKEGSMVERLETWKEGWGRDISSSVPRIRFHFPLPRFCVQRAVSVRSADMHAGRLWLVDSETNFHLNRAKNIKNLPWKY